MTRAEERALEAYPMKDYNKEPNYIHSCDTKTLDEVYREVFMLGYKQAEKDLGWHSVHESLPEIDKEVIVLTNRVRDIELDSANRICFAHIVDRSLAMDWDGWNIPGVKFWMPFPKIPEEVK